MTFCLKNVSEEYELIISLCKIKYFSVPFNKFMFYFEYAGKRHMSGVFEVAYFCNIQFVTIDTAWNCSLLER